jgi:hypothetical protein
MKKVLFLFSFFLIFLSGKTQIWCPSGATWYYGFQGSLCDGYLKFEYVNDTVINTVNCKVIKSRLNQKCGGWQNYYETEIGSYFMYSDTDKVYYYDHGQFYVLYDFSVNTGDTLYVKGITRDWWGNCDSIAQLIVDSTGIMNVNSEALRFYSVHTISGSAFGWDCRIVEKIGPLYNYQATQNNYFFSVKQDVCGLLADEQGEGASFRCYYDDNFPTISLTQYSCDYTLATSENEFQSVYLYPNPASTTLTIDLKDHYTDNYCYQIFSVTGNLIVNEKSNSSRQSIDLSLFPSGIYFLKINSGDDHYIQKLILEK